MLERIILPILVCLLATATCALCAFLFVTLKTELQQIDRRRSRDSEELRAGLNVLRDRVQDVTLELESAPSRSSIAALPMPNAVNINKRTQALRMVKRGEGPERIAAILNLSPREVDLLVKVEKLIAGATATRATA